MNVFLLFYFFSHIKKFLKTDVIVIVNDIFLTGSQTKKAIEYYLTTNFEDEEMLREINSDKKNNRYFTFPSLEHAKFFRENFHMVEKVIFLSG